MLIPAASIPAITSQPLDTVQEAENIDFHVIRQTKVTETEAEENTGIPCTNEGCVASFSSSEELSNHLLVGNCDMEFDLKSSSSSDVTKRKYLQKISECGIVADIKFSLPDERSVSQDADLPLGWALKDQRRCKRFTENQREYLTEKFNVGAKTGRKEDPFVLSESMLYVTKEDGTRRFTYDEILSVQQITSFFSRLSRKNKSVDDWEAKKETEISRIRSEILDEV